MNENIKKRPLSGKFPLLKNKIGEKKNLIIQNNNKLNTLKELNNNKYNNNDDNIETKLYTKTFAETKENNINNSSINQLTEKTEFLEMFSKQKENDKEALDNIIINEVNRIKNVNEKRKKLNEINLMEKNYDDLYLWENLFNNSRPLSHYTTLKKRKIEKLEENKDIEEFKSPIILVDLYEDQMNLYFGKKNIFHTDNNKKKIKSAKVKLPFNKSKSINKNNKNPKDLTINTNINPINSTLKSKKSSSARNRIIIGLSSRKSQRNKNKSFHKYIRPMSVYSPRVNTCSFYFSNAFSDYYKEDLKSFSNKLKILKAKVKSNPSHLKHEIKEQRKIALNKERKLNQIIDSNKIVFDKEDLIIAADRKNPKPLLKSIFRTNYPDKEVMKENIKMYYNTMKPMGNWDESVDFTKNDRWGFCEKFSEMRGGVKKEYNNKEIGKNKNFILKYYNENDPYIQMFEKMAKNRISILNDLKNNTDKNELDVKNDYNPIISKAKEEFPFIKEKEFANNNVFYEKPRLEINEENMKNKINLDLRPKTGYKSVGSHIKTNFKNYNTNTKNIKRPQTSNVKEIKMTDNNYYVPNSNLEYKSKDSLPIKTSSNVGNVSYDKINQMLHERQFGLSKIKNDYFLTSTGQSNKEKYFKYKEEKIIFPNFKKNNRIYDLGELSDLRLDCFSEKGNTPRDKIIWTEEYFKNFRNKHYSSSNNVHIKNKRKNKVDLLNKYYTQSQYSNDEPEIEMIDRSVSSQTNSFNRKL
jgi:hypothetical protein